MANRAIGSRKTMTAAPMALTPTLDEILEALPREARIADFGGWRAPNPHATHVVDWLPWETRGMREDQTAPLPGEKFTRETWMQANFLAPDFRLPIEDDFFDLGICSQTIEDLSNPEPLVREMNRVCRAGYLEGPSRLAEQTVGIRDRITSLPGHPHHHWILEAEAGGLTFFEKTASVPPGDNTTRFPLLLTEKLLQSGMYSRTVHCYWKGSLRVRFVRGTEAWQAARSFRDRHPGAGALMLRDRVTRAIRGLKHGYYWRNPEGRTIDDWKRIVEASRKYSSIPLDSK